jgi:hypothetical protein
VPDAKPRFVDLSPVPGGDPGECFASVTGHVQREGGAICHGWRIWELPRVFIEAEFHAVWRDPAERLVDITPIPWHHEFILFLPDPAKVYEGRQVNNVRRPLTDIPAIYDFFRASDDGFELMNRGDRAGKHGTITLRGAAKDEWLSIETRKVEALKEVLGRLGPPGRNDPCPCGTGTKYKQCHGA